MARATAPKRGSGGSNPIGEWLQRALDDGQAVLSFDGTRQRIRYVAIEHSESYDDPEEWVRADFWAELIYSYGYSEHRLAIEVPVPDRVPGDYVDIVVCRDDARTDPYAVIECKPEGATVAVFEQAVEQAVGNGTWAKLRADYVMVVAGSTRRVLDVKNFGVRERVRNVIADLPRGYGTPTEFKFHKGGPIDLAPVTREEMITILEKCHDTLWGGGKLSPPQAFGELCKIIFVKITDEQKPRRVGEPYDVQVRTGETPVALAGRILALYNEQRRRTRDIFTSDLAVEPQTLKLVVEHIQSTNFRDTPEDVKGLAFERFMDSFFKGDFGQYFTPRLLIEFCIEMLDCHQHLEPTDLVIDPACGSGGFLLQALKKIREERAAHYATEGTVEFDTLWRNFASRNLFGIEINDEISRVAKMNMILHGDGHANVARSDALLSEGSLRELNESLEFGTFDLVLTNPPFGAKLRLEERPFLAGFQLGNTYSKTGRAKPRKSQASEIIFIERVFDFLKPGSGRAAVVLPDGILTNSRTKYVREFILDRFQVLAVVSLPAAAFAHYGAGVKASIVFLRRLGDGENPPLDADVFMAEAALVGYDATGRPIANELPSIVGDFGAFLRDATPFRVDLPEAGPLMDVDGAGDEDGDEDE